MSPGFVLFAVLQNWLLNNSLVAIRDKFKLAHTKLAAGQCSEYSASFSTIYLGSWAWEVRHCWRDTAFEHCSSFCGHVQAKALLEDTRLNCILNIQLNTCANSPTVLQDQLQPPPRGELIVPLVHSTPAIQGLDSPYVSEMAVQCCKEPKRRSQILPSPYSLKQMHSPKIIRDTFIRFDAGKFNYGVDNRTLLAIEFFLFAWVELRRYQDMKKPGVTNQDPIFTNNKLPEGNEPGYPGKAQFNAGNSHRLAILSLACWKAVSNIFNRMDRGRSGT